MHRKQSAASQIQAQISRPLLLRGGILPARLEGRCQILGVHQAVHGARDGFEPRRVRPDQEELLQRGGPEVALWAVDVPG